jgi:NADH-quinone oxidoreductase subunit N
MITAADFIRILPEIVLTVFGTVLMVMESNRKAGESRKALPVVAMAGTLLAIAATLYQAGHPGTAWWGVVRVDEFSVFFHLIVLFVVAVVILASHGYMETQGVREGEYYALILLGAVGMGLMSAAVELLLIFIALEISSIATYVLAGFRRRSPAGVESSLKYFLLGSFATAFFLYGVAMMFGATGSTSIVEVGRVLGEGGAPVLAYIGVALMFVGLAFKLAAAPFHVWTPDVYEGAPSPVVAFLSTAPKAAIIAVALRILFGMEAPGWFWLVWVAAVLSMTLGNIGALVQTSVKRLLAYSSIAHAGYVLVAFAALPEAGISAAVFYAAAYAVMNVGAFAIVSHLASSGERYVTLEDFAGLASRSPGLAAALTVFMLSLIGIPATGGFFAKVYVFAAALEAGLVGLVILAVLNSAIAAYYYLRVVVVMYMKEPRTEEETPLLPVPLALQVGIAASVAATIYLGVLPSHVLDYALRAAQALLR